MSSSAELQFYYQRGWLWFSVVGGLTGSAFLLYQAATVPRGRIITVVFGIFLGYCGAMCRRMLANTKPVIRISSSGIEDNQNGFGLIPWDEITDARLSKGYNRGGPDYKMLLLKLRELKPYMNRLTAHQRFWVRYRRLVGLKDVCLDFTMLNGDPVETLAVIQEHTRNN
jgi:hypothetical protein